MYCTTVRGKNIGLGVNVYYLKCLYPFESSVYYIVMASDISSDSFLFVWTGPGRVFNIICLYEYHYMCDINIFNSCKRNADLTFQYNPKSLFTISTTRRRYISRRRVSCFRRCVYFLSFVACARSEFPNSTYTKTLVNMF